MTESDLLTPSEAAARLRISRRTLDGHVASGGIRYISVGLGLKRKRIRFDPADLESFLERQKRAECPSTNVRARRLTRTISASGAIDFQALLEQRRAERRSARKSGLGR
ncbi:helix-turn-helix domain-containing protein [Methylobacterium brachiatum]|uniref:helix-turn-helix domain-containing protein n=1 Tax=Methylobacterium brachiatum TaxID=269660 RepID=UPI003C7E5382